MKRTYTDHELLERAMNGDTSVHAELRRRGYTFAHGEWD